jgi:N-dimethylarginine dimethylaminohydrolase
MHRILMCKPTFFDVTYSINPWMAPEDPDKKVNRGEAFNQWNFLRDTILDAGATVEYVKPISGLPDLCFTANAGLVHGNKVLVSKFRHRERQDEACFNLLEFERLGFETAMADHEFEGAGDAFILQDTLFLGNGPRSDLKIIPQILEFFDLKKVVVCDLVNPRFYHLDTCFCPLADNRVMWFPGAFSESTRKAIASLTWLNTHEVKEADAHNFACNSVVIQGPNPQMIPSTASSPETGKKTVIVPRECESTVEMLRACNVFRVNFEVIEVPMDQFMKAGGAAKCLTLRLNTPEPLSLQPEIVKV